MPKYTAICTDMENSQIIINIDAKNIDEAIKEIESCQDVKDIIYIEIDGYEPTHLDWFLRGKNGR